MRRYGVLLSILMSWVCLSITVTSIKLKVALVMSVMKEGKTNSSKHNSHLSFATLSLYVKIWHTIQFLDVMGMMFVYNIYFHQAEGCTCSDSYEGWINKNIGSSSEQNSHLSFAGLALYVKIWHTTQSLDVMGIFV